MIDKLENYGHTYMHVHTNGAAPAALYVLITNALSNESTLINVLVNFMYTYSELHSLLYML